MSNADIMEKPDIPLKLYSNKEPLQAVAVSNTKLTAPDSPNDVRHVVISVKGSKFRYLEGQSAGILPPGTDAADKPHKLRLYSIASPAVGDDGTSETFSLCVKRVVYTDEAGVEHRGVGSNFLCDLKPGDPVNVTGPAGVDILMPPTPDANIIMVATGTGIAPWRAFLHKRYAQNAGLSGQTWLIFGAQTQRDFLYADELHAYEKHDDFKLVTAFSREQQTADGSKMYVQNRVEEHAEALLEMLNQKNTYFYICGLKGMENGILAGFENACQAKGVSWSDLFNTLKTEHRWRVEVY